MSEPIAPSNCKRRLTAVLCLVALVLALIVAGVWWYRSGSPRATLRAGEVAKSVAFSPDGKLLAVGCQLYDYERHCAEGIITLWDVSTHRQTARWVAHGDSITSLEFDREGRTLTSTAVSRENGQPKSREVKTWDLETHGEVGDPKTIRAAKRLPVKSTDGRVVARLARGGILVLETVGGDELFRLEADPLQVNCAAFSSDGRTLATGGGYTGGGGPHPFPGKNGDLRLWDVGTGRLLAKYNRHWWGPIEAVAFSPDGKTVATASLDGTVKLWDVPGR